MLAYSLLPRNVFRRAPSLHLLPRSDHLRFRMPTFFIDILLSFVQIVFPNGLIQGRRSARKLTDSKLGNASPIELGEI